MADVSLVPRMRWIDQPDDLDDALMHGLASCWQRVSDAGGAVGFPFPPVGDVHVRDAAESLKASLGRHHRLLAIEIGEELAGWLVLQLNNSPLTAHWGVVSRVQTDLPYRGVGLGRTLMAEVAREADHLGLEQLHIAVRGGQGIEDFYLALGWRVVGRWPAALRL
jgi:GNAT superfamily N-acetyltransferase